MTMPAAGADGVRANDDDSTSTRATRGGDVAQGQATAGREGAPFVADTATEHARPTDAVARRAVRFGEGNAEGRGSGSGRLTSRLPAGAKQKEAAHGGAPPTTRSRDEHVRQAEGGRRDGRRRNRALQGGEPGGPSSVPGRYALDEVGSRLRAGGTPVLGRPNGETVGNQKQERRTSFAGLALTVQHHARSHRLSSTELRGGQNGSRRKEKSAGAAAASYRRHDSRRHGCRGWPTLPSGPPRSRRQQRPTRPRPRRRSTGERNAADGSRQRTQRRRERRRSRRYHRRLRRRRRRSLVLLRARHGRLRD